MSASNGSTSRRSGRCLVSAGLKFVLQRLVAPMAGLSGFQLCQIPTATRTPHPGTLRLGLAHRNLFLFFFFFTFSHWNVERRMLLKSRSSLGTHDRPRRFSPLRPHLCCKWPIWFSVGPFSTVACSARRSTRHRHFSDCLVPRSGAIGETSKVLICHASVGASMPGMRGTTIRHATMRPGGLISQLIGGPGLGILETS